MSTFLVFNCLLLAWCKTGTEKWSLWSAMPHISWHVANAQTLASIFLKTGEVTPRDNLGWVLLLNYLIYVTLPLRLQFCVKLSIGTCVSYLVLVVVLPKADTNSMQQVINETHNILLLTAAAWPFAITVPHTRRHVSKYIYLRR